MLRPAVRRAPSKTARRSIGRITKAKRAQGYKTPVYQAKITSFLNDIDHFLTQRRRQYGANDAVYKRLNKVYSALTREMRKKNFLNPTFVRQWKQLSPAFRGVASAPASVKSNIIKIARHIREQVKKDVVVVLNILKSTVTQMQKELTKLDKELTSHVAKNRRDSKVQLTIDPSLRKRYLTINSNFNRFKTRWNKQLNFLNTHGDKNIQTQVKALKNQIETLQKSFKKHQTVINRFKKPLKAGYRKENLINSNHVHNIESKWNTFTIEFDSKKPLVVNHIERLKAVKQF